MSDLLDDRTGLSAKRASIEEIVRSQPRLIPIACLHCWEPIPAESFSYWSPANRVLSVMCPGCDRQVVLTAATWRLWSGLTG
jgi:hypothetical protein